MTTITAPPREDRKAQSLLEAWPALLSLCLTMLVKMLDNSILNIALPVIGRDLGSTSTGLQWIVSAYSLTFGAFLMVGGTLGDRLGRRRTLLWGLAFFGLAGLCVMFCHTTGQLIAIRALSGAFAASIAPLTMSLVFRLFDDDALRGKAIGVIITVSMAGFAIGPVLSGLAVENWDWHWLLMLNAPTALIAWLGVYFGLAHDDTQAKKSGPIDFAGAIFSGLAVSLLLYALTNGAELGWGAPRTLMSLGGSVLALVAFIWREHTAKDPMLDLSFFQIPTLTGSAILQVATQLAMAAVMFASAELYQYAWGWRPWVAGVANLPFVIGMLAAGPVVDKMVEKYGQRFTCAVGTAFVLVSLVVWWVGVGTNYAWCATGMLLMTIGMRTVMTTAAVGLIGSLPEEHTSIGAALNDTAQELGNSIGVAVIGTVMAIVVGVDLPHGAWSDAVVDTFVHSQRIAFTIIAGLLTVTAAIGLRTLSNSHDTEGL